MNIQQLIVVGGLPLLCSACVTAEELAAADAAKAARLAEFEQTVPTCGSEIECKAKWEAAQLWIAKNAGYKIQIATDVLIETYNSIDYSTSLAARAMKEPLGDGRYAIRIRLGCANWFSCYPDPVDASLDFNRAVELAGLAVAPPLSPAN